MPSPRPARGGGRWVSVEPERLDGFFARFADRHGALAVASTPAVVTVRAADGAVAECTVPFPPMPVDAGEDADADESLRRLTAHARRDRRVGVLLVRRGGYAVGVFAGTELVASKVGSRHVQGRAAAGGWSQQRFARRRAGQARVAFAAAADAAAAVLLTDVRLLDAVVTGGDRAACADVLADPRLAALAALVVAPRLQVPDPRRQVLLATPAAFRAVRIRVVDPDPQPDPDGAAAG